MSTMFIPGSTAKTEHRKIFLSWFLGYFSPKNWTVFNCYKHPPIRLHEKTVQFWADFGRNSPKTKGGKFENSFVFSETFWAISPKFSPNSKSFFMQSYRGIRCLIGIAIN